MAGCADNFDEDLKAVQEAPFLSTGGTTGGPPTTGGEHGMDPDTSTSSAGAGGDDATTDTGADATTTAGEGEGESSGGSGGILPPPAILEVDMPGKVALAGPVEFTVTTEHASSARARLDGVDIGALHDKGGGIFSGTVAVFGSVDNGPHVLEVIAEREALSDHRSVQFVVGTPAPGSVGWVMAGPVGSHTRRIALTPERDVIEAGLKVIAGVERPVIRKRSGVDGSELWGEGTIVLDEREGRAVDVAVTPDGRMWVAMNVREAANKWRPRIVLLDANGKFLNVEVPAEAGQTVTGVDNDGSGGCVAVGFVGSGLGDTDVAIWRMNGEHVPVLSGKAWDYQPAGELEAHKFTDLATDVVVNEGVAWIVGLSVGKHGDFLATRSRGFILRVDIDTAGVLGPVIIAPDSALWTQSKFLGAAMHPDGILVTGNGCNGACDTQRVETALYTAAGARTWFLPEDPEAAVAYGSAVALNSHGGVAVAATIREGAALRGFLLGRVVHGDLAMFSVPFPASKEDSEATGVAIDAFDRVFGAGYRTFGGVTEARAVLIQP